MSSFVAAKDGPTRVASVKLRLSIKSTYRELSVFGKNRNEGRIVCGVAGHGEFGECFTRGSYVLYLGDRVQLPAWN